MRTLTKLMTALLLILVSIEGFGNGLAGADQTVSCVTLPGGTATMAALGSGVWTARSGNPGTAIITTPGSASTTITTFSAAGTYYFLWTVSGTTDTATVTVTSKPNAGPNQNASCVILPGGSATMAATGAGTWIALSGNPGTATITSATSPTTTIRNYTAAGTYNFAWVSGTGCSDTTSVIVTAMPGTPTLTLLGSCLGTDSLVVHGAAAAGDSIIWSSNAFSSELFVSPGADSIFHPTIASTNTGYAVEIKANGCWSYISDTVAVSSCSAGPNQLFCRGVPFDTVTMAATGTGTWSAFPSNVQSSTIVSPSSPTTKIYSHWSAGVYGFVWTTGGVRDTMTVTIDSMYTAGGSISVSHTTICSGSADTFHVTPLQAFSSPVYHWYVNGILSGNTSSAFITSALTSNDSVWAEIVSTWPCNYLDSARSNVIHVTVNNCGCNLTGHITSTGSGSYTLTAVVSGGSGAYNYLWSVSNGTNNGSQLTVSNNGVYSVTVTDTAGCTLILHDTISNLSCNITDSIGYQYLGAGQYRFTAYTTGTSHTNYWWQLGAGGGYSASNPVTYTMPAGPQYVVVHLWDSLSNCQNEDSIWINVPCSALQLHIVDTTISGAPYQAADVTGTFVWGPGISYRWSDTTAIASISTMPVSHHPGTNCVTVTDNYSGCTATACWSTAGCNITLIADTIIPTPCGYNYGYVQVSASGGTPTYYYKNGIGGTWQSNTYFNNLAAGTDTFYVRDTMGCTQSVIVTIGAYPGSPSVSISTSSTIICPGQVDTFYATPTAGGTSPSYQWYHNGIAGGANSSSYVASGLTTNDTIITVVMISSLACASPDTVSGTIHITIGNQVPAVSITDRYSAVCSGALDTFYATPTNGGSSPSYQWYHNGIAGGGNSSVYAASGLTTNDTIIRVVMTSNLSCASPATASSQITLIVNPTPSAPTLSLTGSACSMDTLHLSGAGGASIIDWYRGGTLVSSSSLSYTPYGTIAGGNGVGSAANQLHYPSGIALDASGNLYVTDGLNYRVQKFPAGSTSATNGVTVAGGNGAGTALNQVWVPRGITVDAAGNVYVGEINSYRVQKFPAGSTSATNGTIVAGGNGNGNGGNATSAPLGLHVDAAGNLFVTDFSNNRIEEFPAGSTSATYGTVIAGESYAGASAYLLDGPTGSCFDSHGFLYVADYYNNRVQRFPPGSTLGSSAVTVAGGNGTGSALNQVVQPESVVVDAAGNIYVSDQGNNRILRFPPGSTSATNGVVVAGGNGAGSAANQFNSPYNILVDAQNNIYIADLNNYRVQKWSAVAASTTYLTNTQGTYTATYVAADGCASAPSGTVTVASCACTGHDSISYVNLGGSRYTFTAHSTGSANPQYMWFAGVPNQGGPNASFSGATWTYTLPAGHQYVVLVTRDSLTGCMYEDSITFNVPCSNFVVHIVDTVIGGAPYQVAEVTGGNGSYTYRWSDTTNSANIAFMPVSHHTGINCVTVTDNFGGCSGSACLPYTNCSLSESTTNVNQGTAEQITVTITGGSGNYTYGWSPNIPVGQSSGGIAYAPADGIYTLTVTDTTGCSIVVPDTVTGLSCAVHDTISYTYLGGGQYSFVAHESGSANPEYRWYKNPHSGISSGVTFNYTLPSGNQTMVLWVTDSITGCMNTDSIIIAVPNYGCNMLLTDSILPTTCGYNYGYVGVYASGGTAPYSYKNGIAGTWQSNDYFNNLAAGTDTFYVRDSTGCSQYLVATVIASGSVSPSVLITASSSTVCSGGMDTIVATPTDGGTSPSYQWYINGVASGTNSATYVPASLTSNDTIIDVVMTSSLACASPPIATDLIHITIRPAPAAPALSLIGGCLGYDSLVVTGGRGTPQYNWDLNGAIAHSSSGSNIDSFYTPATAGSYTATIAGLNGCTSPPSNTVIVNVCLDTVWPGDADNNRMVDNRDLLTIGLAYDSTGPVRTVQGIVWQGDVATDWAHNFSIYAPLVNFNHADCNGDGIINADDTLAIVTNFGDTHAKTSDMPGPWTRGVPGFFLTFSRDTAYNGDTLYTAISLGNVGMGVPTLYGLAFTFNYDPIPVDSANCSFSFVNSWLGTSANSINIAVKNNAAGTVRAAITGINHMPRSGYGQIATFAGVITTGNINGKDLHYYANKNFISDVTAIDQYGNPVPLNIPLDSNVIAYYPNGITDVPQAAKVNIYPNPASNQVRITSGTAIYSVTIDDVLGNEVRTIQVNNKLNEAIDISGFETGVYIIRVSTAAGTATARLVVSR